MLIVNRCWKLDQKEGRGIKKGIDVETQMRMREFCSFLFFVLKSNEIRDSREDRY